MTLEESRRTGSGALSCVFAGESEGPAPRRRTVGSIGFMLRPSVLRLLDDDTDVWRYVGTVIFAVVGTGGIRFGAGDLGDCVRACAAGRSKI